MDNTSGLVARAGVKLEVELGQQIRHILDYNKMWTRRGCSVYKN